MKEKLQATLDIAKQNKLKVATGVIIALLIASQAYLYLMIVSVERYSAPANFQVTVKQKDGTDKTINANLVKSVIEISNYLMEQIDAQQISTDKTGNANPSDTQPRPTETK